MKKEIVGNDINDETNHSRKGDFIKIVNKIEALTSEDKTIKDIKNDFPHEMKNLEEALKTYISEKDLKIFQTDFAGKWNYSIKKLA